MPLRQPVEPQASRPGVGRGPAGRVRAAALAVALMVAGALGGLLTAGCEMGSRDWSEAPPTGRDGQPLAPSSPAPVPARATSAKAERPVAASPRVREAQQLLRELGRDVGPVDGIAGRRTRDAVLRFQRERGLAATGRVSQPLLAELRRAVRESQKRPSTTPRTPAATPAPAKVALPKSPSSEPAARTPAATPVPPEPAPTRGASPEASSAEAPPVDVLPREAPPVDHQLLTLPPAELPPAEAPAIGTPAGSGDRGEFGRLPRPSDPE